MKEETLSVGANDQVNPDAAQSVECNEQRSSAARVERLVRRFCDWSVKRSIRSQLENS